MIQEPMSQSSNLSALRNDDRPVVVTGVAGFVGFHLARRLLADGRTVVGIDVMNDYYDCELKRARVAELAHLDGFRFCEDDCADEARIAEIFGATEPGLVIHLAAQAGVRHSISHPQAYLRSNLVGFGTVIDACRQHDVDHFLYASSSSVYGDAAPVPFDVHDPADHPMSLYAATKRSNELIAHSYSHLYAMATTGLRFFTVYGPWGRPDMAYFRFAEAILANEPLQLYGDGSVVRDFTYVDDVVEAIVRVCDLAPEPGGDWSTPAVSVAPFRLYNIGHGGQATINELIGLLERKIGRVATIEHLPVAAGDVSRTHADTTELAELVGFTPSVTLDEGISEFVDWLTDYHRQRG